MTTYTLTGWAWDYIDPDGNGAQNLREAVLTITATENYSFSYSYPFASFGDPEIEITDVNGELQGFDLNGYPVEATEYTVLADLVYGSGQTATFLTFFIDDTTWGSDYAFFIDGDMPAFWDDANPTDTDLNAWGASVTDFNLVTTGPYAPGQEIPLATLYSTITSEDDTVSGTDMDDVLTGGIGNDLLQGFLGDDQLDGGAGADVLDGGDGIDTADYLSAANSVFADLINNGDNTGDAAGDSYVSIENLRGTLRADDLRGDNADNLINGSNGNDFVLGRGGADVLIGGNGDDTLVGMDGNDVLNGGADNDRLIGGEGNDRLVGQDGADSLIGTAGNNSMIGGAGNDIMFDGRGDSTLFGGTGADTLIGGVGNDRLLGSFGNDRLSGGNGADRLSGGDGNDYMVGGNGTDTFSFQPNMGADRVEDFTLGEDRIFIDSVLTGGEMDVATVFATFGDDSGAYVVFDFGGGNTLELLNQTTLVGMESDFLIV